VDEGFRRCEVKHALRSITILSKNMLTKNRKEIYIMSKVGNATMVMNIRKKKTSRHKKIQHIRAVNFLKG